MNKILTIILSIFALFSCKKDNISLDIPKGGLTSKTFTLATFASNTSKLVVTMDNRLNGHVDLDWGADIDFTTVLHLHTNKGKIVKTPVEYVHVLGIKGIITSGNSTTYMHLWNPVNFGRFKIELDRDEFVNDVFIEYKNAMVEPHSRTVDKL